MPNDPSERIRASREPHARPGNGAPERPGRARLAARRSGATGALKTPAGVGIATMALVAMVLAMTGMFGQAGRNPDAVAVAGGTPPPSASPAPSAPGNSPSADPIGATPSQDPAAPAPTPSAAPTLDPLAGVPTTRLQKTIDAWRKKTGVPGVSVAIAWDDGRSWAGASGHSDVASGERMTPGTGFAFASVSKMVTAAVVMQLIDEGLVGLDQPAVELLPDYPLDTRITVRMLLDHRSSLPDFFANAKIDKALQADKDATWTASKTWKFVPKWRPRPGTIYDYSNTNYLLLGELVERVTGNTLAREVRTRIFAPLGLETAWYQAYESPRAPLSTGYRLTRTAGGSAVRPVAQGSAIMPFRSVVTAAGGAGSIAGTATDAARFMQAYGSGTLLGPRMHREMIADSKYTRAMRAIVTYGLGVQVITIQDQKTLGHSGRYLGYQNTVRYLRGPGISISIMTNQNTYDPAVLMRTIIRVVAPVK